MRAHSFLLEKFTQTVAFLPIGQIVRNGTIPYKFADYMIRECLPSLAGLQRW